MPACITNFSGQNRTHVPIAVYWSPDAHELHRVGICENHYIQVAHSISDYTLICMLILHASQLRIYVLSSYLFWTPFIRIMHLSYIAVLILMLRQDQRLRGWSLASWWGTQHKWDTLLHIRHIHWPTLLQKYNNKFMRYTMNIFGFSEQRVDFNKFDISACYEDGQKLHIMVTNFSHKVFWEYPIKLANFDEV